VVDLNHTQLSHWSCVFTTYHKANDGVVHAIRAWFKYDTALSAVV